MIGGPMPARSLVLALTAAVLSILLWGISHWRFRFPLHLMFLYPVSMLLVLNVRLLFGLAFTTFQTTFALFAQKRLGLNAQATSYVLTYVGLLVVAVQGGGISLLSRRFSDKQLIFGSSILLTLSLLGWALTSALLLLLAVLAPLALAGGVFNVVGNSALTKSVYPEEEGMMLKLRQFYPCELAGGVGQGRST